MKKASEILDELLNESRQIEKFINEHKSLPIQNFVDGHARGNAIPPQKYRAIYAAGLLYISIDWYSAVLLLTSEQSRGPALASIRPMFESFVKGTWIIAIPSNDEIDRITKNNEPLKSKKICELIDDLEENNQENGKIMREFWDSISKYLNDCLHSNNEHINRFFNEETQAIEQNIEDNEMAHMLHMANQFALRALIFMQMTHTQDIDFIRPFYQKHKEYVAYSSELLEPIRQQLAGEVSDT